MWGLTAVRASHTKQLRTIRVSYLYKNWRTWVSQNIPLIVVSTLRAAPWVHQFTCGCCVRGGVVRVIDQEVNRLVNLVPTTYYRQGRGLNKVSSSAHIVVLVRTFCWVENDEKKARERELANLSGPFMGRSENCRKLRWAGPGRVENLETLMGRGGPGWAGP